MCLGAAMEVGIDVVIYGLEAPADGGTSRLAVARSPENLLPRVRGGARRAGCAISSWPGSPASGHRRSNPTWSSSSLRPKRASGPEAGKSQARTRSPSARSSAEGDW